jgi:hypothetical protein
LEEEESTGHNLTVCFTGGGHHANPWSLASALDDVGNTPAALRNYQKYLKLAENDSVEARRVEWTKIRMRSLKAKE